MKIIYLSLMWSKETSNIRIEIQDQQLMGSYKETSNIRIEIQDQQLMGSYKVLAYIKNTNFQIKPIGQPFYL